MVMDFSGTAGASSDFDLLPKGQLAFAVLTVRGVKASASGGQYIDCELTIDQGQPYAGRKLWDMIGDPFHAGNSEKYRNMGMLAITRILETGRNAGPHNPAGYQLNDFSELSGLRVAIKIGVEEGTGGHEDKNRVAEWLTPNPASQSGYKGFEKLLKGDVSPNGGTSAGAGGFGAPAATGGATTGGFGNASGSAAPSGPATAPTPGFGNIQPGFQQPPASISAATGVSATTAASPSSTTPAAASPSDPGATPGWLQQAGPQ